MTPEERQQRRDVNAAYRARNRAVINERQRAQYRARKALGTLPPSYMTAKTIAGTLAPTEVTDTLRSDATVKVDLASQYVAALLKRDAVIWHQRIRATQSMSADYDATPVYSASKMKIADLKVTEPKDGAHHFGPKTHEGTPCQRCGGTRRYNASKQCVTCVRRAAVVKARATKAARSVGPRPSQFLNLRPMGRAMN